MASTKDQKLHREAFLTKPTATLARIMQEIRIRVDWGSEKCRSSLI